jgi:nicotinate-nucleotide pyrophosphorylase (carboxylating)
MKICVVGAGSIGGLLGVKLALAGHEVTLIARGANLAAIKANGMTLQMHDGQEFVARDIKATDRIPEAGPQDLVILGMKAHQVEPVVDDLPALCHDDTLILPIVRAALAEDLGRAGDVTAAACVPDGARMRAVFAARKAGVLAGVDCVRLSLLEMDPRARIEIRIPDGEPFGAGAVLAEAEADARAFLSAERTALNLLGRLCGVATLTRAYVEAVAGTGARIADTRKTTPGLRALEKHAVRCGGGVNHRFGLDDAILIKDNHIAVCGGVEPAVRAARAGAGHLMKIEVEVDGLGQLDQALALVGEGVGPDVILLDNFDRAELVEAVRRTRGGGHRVVLEASGGVDLTTVRGIAETGVDVISVGALTHSAPVLDIGLDAV